MMFRLVLALTIARGLASPSANGVSPALAWQSLHDASNKPAAEGLKVIKRIAAEHVIDDFMEKYPVFKAVLWDTSYDQEASESLSMEHAKKLCHNVDLETYMKDRGFVKTGMDHGDQNGVWKKPGTSEVLMAKKTHPKLCKVCNASEKWHADGLMRIFYQDVFSKLREFNSGYGWDNGIRDGLYDGKYLYIIGEGLSGTDVPAANSPRPWVLPQMDYLGVISTDLHHGNFGLIGDYDEAVPVDLDSTQRHISAFSKLNSVNERIDKMEDQFQSIDHHLRGKAQHVIEVTEVDNAVLSPSVIWSAALGVLLGSSLAMAVIQIKKKSRTESSRPLLA